FLAVTFALDTTFPCSSLIVPNRVALVVWAVVSVMNVGVFKDNNAIDIRTANCHAGRRLLRVIIFSSGFPFFFERTVSETSAFQGRTGKTFFCLPLSLFCQPSSHDGKASFLRRRYFPSPIFLLREPTAGRCGREKCRRYGGGGTANSKVSTNSVSTGAPLTTVGSNSHRRAASTAASRNSGCPLMVVALVTRPATEMVTRTSTFPEALNLLAFCGYFGCGLKIGAP